MLLWRNFTPIINLRERRFVFFALAKSTCEINTKVIEGGKHKHILPFEHFRPKVRLIWIRIKAFINVKWIMLERLFSNSVRDF